MALAKVGGEAMKLGIKRQFFWKAMGVARIERETTKSLIILIDMDLEFL